jgi:hypothetical protein
MRVAGPSPGFTSEIKFVVDAAAGRRIREWTRARLAPDPHGTGDFADEYRVSSLYFDTAARDVFHRRGSYGRSKYRIRRYHEEPSVFLERKLRTGARLSKRRTTIDLVRLPLLADERALNGNGAATAWFLRRVAVRGLHPVCQVSYLRTARIADTADGPARVTLDRAMHGAATDAFSFETRPATPLLDGTMILELKYRHVLPAVFKQLVEEFALQPQRSSKYRVAAGILGLVPTARQDAPSTINA